MTTLQQWAESDTAPWTKSNENDDAVSAAAIFAKKATTSTGLTWGYYGGLYNGNTIADGTVTLTNAADNYVVVLRSTGVVSTSTTSTNSLDPLYAKLYKITTAGSVVTTVVDQRWDANGLNFSGGAAGSADMVLAAVQTVTGAKTFGSAGAVGKIKIAGNTSGSLTVAAPAVAGTGTAVLMDGTMATLAGAETLTNKTLTDAVIAGTGLVDATAGFRNIPQNSQSAAYTLVAADSGKHIYHPAADTTARIWTIPANASVAFPIGTAITFDNDFGAGALTIAITTDTLVLVGTAGSTGSRTIASGGQATAIKVTATRWRISGTGLS